MPNFQCYPESMHAATGRPTETWEYYTTFVIIGGPRSQANVTGKLFAASTR